MCLAVLALDAHPRYALVLAANRDEYHARAAAAAAWGREAPFVDIFGGRDLVAGGTWLGVRRDGRFAFVTNVREGRPKDPALRSRGELVPRVLNHAGPLDEALARLEADRYNGFNLVAGDLSRTLWMSNRGHAHACARARPARVVECRARRAVAEARADPASRAAHGSTRATPDTAPLLTALADRAPAEDASLPATGLTLEWERLLSSPFIVSERYGTRCSTVLTIDREGSARFHERSFAPDGTADRRGRRGIRP